MPQWIRLPNPIGFYDFFSIWPAARDAAIAQFQLDTTLYDRFVLIFPQNSYPPLRPAASPLKYYIIPERVDRTDGWFLHMGRHAHEFGHCLGFHDEYCCGNGGTNTRDFDLMAWGDANGPNGGNCPAPVTPYYRMRCGWVTPNVLTRDTTGLVVGYDYEHPILYRINPIDRNVADDEHFIFETRLRQGFDLYTPLPPNMFQQQSGTLLTWRHNSGTDRVALVPGGNDPNNELTSFFPGNRATNFQNFNDFGDEPRPEFQNGQLAHFALNGIHRDSTTNLTHIDSVSVIYGSGLITRNTTWSGSFTLDIPVRVFNPAILTITAGTKITFSGPTTGITINPGSSLVSLGQGSQVIQYKSASGTRGSWRGIQAIGSGAISISHSLIKDALDALICNQPLNSVSNVQVVNCASGVFIGTGHPVVSSCYFENNSIALHITSAETAQIANCAFRQNDISIKCVASSPRIAFNDFKHGTTEIEIMFGASPTISHNQFWGSQGVSMYGIHLRFSDLEPPPSTAMSPFIINNSASYYQYGCLTEPPTQGQPPSTPVLRNNIFFLNQLTTSPSGATIEGNGFLRYSNIYNVDRENYSPPPTNIEVDPMFTEPNVGDFSLRFFSPSVDAGDPADPFDLEPEPNGPAINQGHQGNTPLATRTFNFVVNGTSTGNASWHGDVLVQNNFSIRVQDVVTVQPGTTIRVAIGATIEAFGALQAQGTIADSIHFHPDNPASQWGGIVLRDPSNASLLSYCSIGGAEVGVSLDAATLTLDHSLIANCGTGIDVYTIDGILEPQILSNEIHDCKTGIYFHQAPRVQVNDNHISLNDVGIYAFLSSPLFHYNTIENNRVYGVRTEWADPRFGDYVANDPGCNTIRENTGQDGTADIYASSGSPFLGLFDGSQSFGGFNSVYSSSVGEVRCVVQADNDAHVLTHLTWWNQYPPNEAFFCATNAKIDYSKPLEGIPRECVGVIASLSLPMDQEEQMLRAATVQRAERNYATALNTLTSFVSSRPNSNYIRRALRELRQTYRDYRFWSHDSSLQGRLGSYLSTVATNHPNPTLRATANLLLADELHARRAWSASSARYQQIVQTQPNTNLERTALFSLFAINAYGLRDTAAAGNILLTLRTKYPNDLHTELAETRYALLTGRVSGQMGKPSGPPEQITITRPDHYALEQNFPNPFNPTTIIQYQLPEDAHVELKVYDILGREVTMLVSESQQAGYYKVPFQASQMSSGVYLYRLQAGSFVETKKLLLLK